MQKLKKFILHDPKFGNMLKLSKANSCKKVYGLDNCMELCNYGKIIWESTEII